MALFGRLMAMPVDGRSLLPACVFNASLSTPESWASGCDTLRSSHATPHGVSLKLLQPRGSCVVAVPRVTSLGPVSSWPAGGEVRNGLEEVGTNVT